MKVMYPKLRAKLFNPPFSRLASGCWTIMKSNQCNLAMQRIHLSPNKQSPLEVLIPNLPFLSRLSLPSLDQERRFQLGKSVAMIKYSRSHGLICDDTLFTFRG
jgi:hypothetical protein